MSSILSPAYLMEVAKSTGFVKNKSKLRPHMFLDSLLSGGPSEAGIHIKLEYELLSGKVTDLNITDAKRQDTADAKEIAHSIRKRDLIIRDMGYFVQQYSAISLKLSPTFLAGPGLKLSFMIPGMES